MTQRWMVYEDQVNSLVGWRPKPPTFFNTREAAEAARTHRLAAIYEQWVKEFKLGTRFQSQQDDFVLAESITVIDLTTNDSFSEPFDDGLPF